MRSLSAPVSLTTGANVTLLTQCYDNGTVAARKTGSIYNGYLSINYTTPSSHFSHTAIGTMILKATSPITSHYVPVTLQNSQSSPTPGSFQQMIPVNSLAYQSYEMGGLQNVEFSTGAAGTGTILQSWIESNALSSSTNTLYWVKLPNPIPGNSNVVIYMTFMPSNVMSSRGPTGEAPQLSGTYAQYDSGANVFNFYDNFAGVNINSQYTQVPLSGTTIAQNNGITISTNPSATYGGLILTNGIPGSPTFVYDTDITAVSGVAAGIALQIGNVGSSSGYDFNYWGGSVAYGSMSGGMANPMNPNLQVSTGVDGGAWLSSSSQVWYKNYVASAGTQSVYTLPGTLYPSIGIYAFSTSTSITFQWLRTRYYPPNGVMPSTSFGSLG